MRKGRDKLRTKYWEKLRNHDLILREFVPGEILLYDDDKRARSGRLYQKLLPCHYSHMYVAMWVQCINKLCLSSPIIKCFFFLISMRTFRFLSFHVHVYRIIGVMKSKILQKKQTFVCQNVTARCVLLLFISSFFHSSATLSNNASFRTGQILLINRYNSSKTAIFLLFVYL